MTIQEVIDDLSALGQVHGFRQPVDLDAEVKVKFPVRAGGHTFDAEFSAEGRAPLAEVRWDAGRVLLQTGVPILIEEDEY